MTWIIRLNLDSGLNQTASDVPGTGMMAYRFKARHPSSCRGLWSNSGRDLTDLFELYS